MASLDFIAEGSSATNYDVTDVTDVRKKVLVILGEKEDGINPMDGAIDRMVSAIKNVPTVLAVAIDFNWKF